MRFIYLFSALCVLSTNVFALKQKQEIIEKFDDLNVVSFISPNTIEKSPVWTPGDKQPPLSIQNAIQAVKSFVKNKQAPLELIEIELRPVPSHEEHWHYLIKVANDARKIKYDIYVVLMDGKVIPAIIEPQAYK